MMYVDVSASMLTFARNVAASEIKHELTDRHTHTHTHKQTTITLRLRSG